MPELPDLEVFSENLNKKIAGKKVKEATISRNLKINISAANLKKLIVGASLRKVVREGKELCFMLSDGHQLFLHLMLHGKLYWADEEEEKKNSLFLIEFSNKKILGLTDFQKNAKITVDPAPSEIPDALDRSVNEKFWIEKLQSKAKIKNILLEQKVVRGIGNAYADEILYKAGISPFSIASKIPETAVKALAKAIPLVLKKAQKQIKKQSKDIIGGEMRDLLDIHHPKKKMSPTGGKILTDKKSRITYYSDEQKLYE